MTEHKQSSPSSHHDNSPNQPSDQSSDHSSNQPVPHKPTDSDFHQQRLKAWRPLLAPRSIIIAFGLIGCLFIGLGLIVLLTTQSVVEISHRYDNLGEASYSTCDLDHAQNDPSSSCFAIEITEEIKPPIFVYYHLTNFYQNHRRYVKSRSDPQLQGDSNPSVDSCDPLVRDSKGRTYYPCGLIAASTFNDTINCTLHSGSDSVDLSAKTFVDISNPDWQKKGIAWSSDVDHKFHQHQLEPDQTNISASGAPLPEVDDEDFIVWMRTSALPSFKKLYRKITNPDRILQKGDVLVMSVNDQFPVESFGGQKHIVIATTSWLGGKNLFLGWAFIGSGIASVAVAIVFFIKQCVRPRKRGDLQALKWHHSHQN